ncbi:hypothetical protein VX037_18790 [Gordonia sp. Z-3]|uniref:alpha/beta fold hydrolase n=1 Tax=Gordonia sp. Z-3 TaxID=3115408 RepID=UPI002E2B9F9F|nr:hypothetical protein [Gordonia sp. Z-3]MED5803075.1 hypothetical protein [Gordonia sp. Z-3]
MSGYTVSSLPSIDRCSRSASNRGSSAAMPDARIHVLDGQTHMAHLAAPEEFATAVVEILRD